MPVAGYHGVVEPLGNLQLHGFDRLFQSPACQYQPISLEDIARIAVISSEHPDLITEVHSKQSNRSPYKAFAF
ncbi:hypothetical protein T4D_16251 [Trichinella pseudospiralis]|nr:hypothetical protein T4D_16251 [Trichinella pseudospiralis]